jgi:hypothetical protein
MERRVGLKAAKKAGKKAAKTIAAKKHPAKKHPAKKHPAKKHADKHAAHKFVSDPMLHDLLAGGEDDDAPPRRHAEEHAVELALAFHHLQRAGAVISLLEHDSGGDLRQLLEHGIELYRKATGPGKRKTQSILCAHGLLRAAEHLGMAGLYAARADYRVQVAPPKRSVVADHLSRLGPRLDQLPTAEREMGRRLEAMARELLRRAQDSGHDPHLEYELTMAADGICTALEEGL